MLAKDVQWQTYLKIKKFKIMASGGSIVFQIR